MHRAMAKVQASFLLLMCFSFGVFSLELDTILSYSSFLSPHSHPPHHGHHHHHLHKHSFSPIQTHIYPPNHSHPYTSLAHPPHHHHHHRHHPHALSKPPTHHYPLTFTPNKPPTHHIYTNIFTTAKPPTHHHPHHHLSPTPTHAHPPYHHHHSHAHAKPPIHRIYTPSPQFISHPPAHPIPSSFVAVQGVVYTKSCKHAGADTLLGATALFGAIVKLECNITNNPLIQTVKTNKNGYFYIEADKSITTNASHKCKVFLVSAPNGLKPSNLHGGLEGAILKPKKPIVFKSIPFFLYNVQSLAFEPICPK